MRSSYSIHFAMLLSHSASSARVVRGNRVEASSVWMYGMALHSVAWTCCLMDSPPNVSKPDRAVCPLSGGERRQSSIFSLDADRIVANPVSGKEMRVLISIRNCYLVRTGSLGGLILTVRNHSSEGTTAWIALCSDSSATSSWL